MKKRSVTHNTFTIERLYDATPARVFAAFAQADAKRRWFGGDADGFTNHEYQLDFRVGGRELMLGQAPNGAKVSYDARYADIVDGERIVCTYDMHIDDERISVSLMTVELAPEGDGTRLKLTEQDAFLDGHDFASAREHGTRELLEKLGAALKEAA